MVKKSEYREKKEKGLCVFCKNKPVKGINYCKKHRKKKKQWNKDWSKRNSNYHKKYYKQFRKNDKSGR